MKRSIAITVALILIFSLTVACGGGGGSRAPKDSTADFYEFTWPNSEIAKLIPKPNSNFGKIWIDSSSQLTIDVGNTPQAEFDKYIDECMSKGFNVNYTRLSNDWFDTSNEAGYSLLLSFKADDEIMSIILNAPREDEPEPTPEPTPTPEPQDEDENQDGDESTENTETPAVLDYDWKQFLKDYEKWIDDYIAFLKKYEEDPTNLSLMTEALDLMIKAGEWAERAEEIEVDLENDPAALKEYNEVLSRILKKLTDAL